MTVVAEDSPTEPDAAKKRAQMDALLAEFATAHAGRPRFDETPVPRRLHHYTTLDGLMGIVSSDAIWASDARFLNDSSELSYAAGLIDAVVAEVFDAVSSEALRAALPRRPSVANAFEYGAQPFVACFCEEDDLLSQWRGYDAGQTGFSLGLDLQYQPMMGLPPPTYLRRVVYDEDRQRSAVREVVGTWLETAERLLTPERGLTTADVFPYPAIWALQEALAEHHLCFKHPTFAEEHEWRLIKLVDVREELRLLNDRRQDLMLAATRARMQELGVDMPEFGTTWSQANAEGIDIKFRRSPFGLVPYIELPLKDRAGVFTDRLPLWQVTQGPTSNPELSLESLRMYLDSMGFGFHTELKASGIPLRR